MPHIDYLHSSDVVGKGRGPRGLRHYRRMCAWCDSSPCSLICWSKISPKPLQCHMVHAVIGGTA